MLTKNDIEEMHFLTNRIANGSVTREDWSNLAALVLLSQGDETAASIAAEGLEKFIAISGPLFEGHAFHFDDFQRMYDRICAAGLNYRPQLH